MPDDFYIGLRHFIIKFGSLLLLTPLFGYLLMDAIDSIERAWKSNNKKRKWLVSCALFFLLAIIAGWLQ